MVHLYDHRWATYLRDGTTTRELTSEEKMNPNRCVMPRYWVSEEEVEARLADKWDGKWLMGWRDICRSTDERTVIAGVVPRVGVGHKFLLMFPSGCSASAMMCLIANLSSLPLDFAARQKLGGTSMAYFVLKQLPVLPPPTYLPPTPWASEYSLGQWVASRVASLLTTTDEMSGLSIDLEQPSGFIVWHDERRFLIRCELDAAFFHLYGLARDDVEYILNTFPIVKKNDEKIYGEFRTARTIIGIYDAMAEAIAGAAAAATYETPLD